MFYLFILLAFIGTIYAFLAYRVDMDDFYITMRYADNIAGGKGWVFNPGERVLGTTTPLLTLLLVFPAFLGISPILGVRIIWSLFLFGTSFFIRACFHQKGKELIGFAAGLLFFCH